jgi:hypothetical protein
MSETRRPVPWPSGTVAGIGRVPRRLPQTAKQRAAQKRGQIASSMAELERRESVLRARGEDKAADALAGALAFQRQRLLWLQEADEMRGPQLSAAVREMEAGLGPKTLTALRGGRTEEIAGISEERLARYALLSYVLRG